MIVAAAVLGVLGGCSLYFLLVLFLAAVAVAAVILVAPITKLLNS